MTRAVTVSRMSPLTKAARQAEIGRLIAGSEVRSQAELGVLLTVNGISVTQATLSRDLEELGATKARGRYVLPGGLTPPAADGGSRLARLAEELLLAAESAANLLVLRTPPGGAHLLASGLDRTGWPEVVGSVAGDDTVLLVCRDDIGARALCTRLLGLADGS